MEPRTFTWYGSYTKALETIPENDRWKFVQGVINYGSYGTEPFFEYPLSLAFELVRPNIDTNIKKRQGGAKGGRPKKEPENQVEEI